MGLRENTLLACSKNATIQQKSFRAVTLCAGLSTRTEQSPPREHASLPASFMSCPDYDRIINLRKQQQQKAVCIFYVGFVS